MAQLAEVQRLKSAEFSSFRVNLGLRTKTSMFTIIAVVLEVHFSRLTAFPFRKVGSGHLRTAEFLFKNREEWTSLAELGSPVRLVPTSAGIRCAHAFGGTHGRYFSGDAMKNRAEVRGQRPCTRAAMMVAPRWDVARASGGPKSASAVALQRAKNNRVQEEGVRR